MFHLNVEYDNDDI